MILLMIDMRQLIKDNWKMTWGTTTKRLGNNLFVTTVII